MKLVHIIWKDSTSMQGGVWHDKDHIKDMKIETIESVGWIIKETKKKIIIASHFSTYQCSGDMAIPKACIKKITKLGDTNG